MEYILVNLEFYSQLKTLGTKYKRNILLSFNTYTLLIKLMY